MVADIEIVAAFDVDENKVGKDLSDASFEVNVINTEKIADIPKIGVPVLKGPVLDGVGNYLKGVVEIDLSQGVNVAQALKESDTEVLVNLLPSGATNASHWYTEQALLADCAFINVTPTSIASDLAWDKRFKKAGLPVVGDDLIDQVGPGGQFMAEHHTADHCRDEIWVSALMDREPWINWQAAGAQTALDRIRAKLRKILETHEPPPLPSGAAQQIEAILQAAEAREGREH